jgi:hypothetical protein
VKLIQFCDPGGHDVWIVGRWVTRVTYPVPTVQAQNARAVIWMGANQQAVTESVEEVVQMLEAGE